MQKQFDTTNLGCVKYPHQNSQKRRWIMAGQKRSVQECWDCGTNDTREILLANANIMEAVDIALTFAELPRRIQNVLRESYKKE